MKAPLLKYAAELLGTFIMVFIGTGAIVLDDWTHGGVSHLGVSLAFGVAVAAMVFAFGRLSGAHINPAVTLAFWFSGRFPRPHLMPYIISQLLGAFCASILLHFMAPSHPDLGSTYPTVGMTASVILEVLLTFILMWVILWVSTGSKEIGKWAPIAIGGTVFLEAYLAGPLTGASMNPARSFGPALASGQLAHLWMYLLAPVMGAMVAVFACRLLKGKKCCATPGALCH